MPSASSPVRTLMTACSVVLLWLASALPASAAPPTERLAAGGPVCELQTATLRKLTRLHRSFGGPLKQAPPRQLLFGLTDPTARVRRGTRTAFHGQQAAIQNDAPAARLDHHDGALPSLRPLERLGGAVDAHPRSRPCAPPEPRGPPLAA
jgi:hypothetical protein